MLSPREHLALAFDPSLILRAQGIEANPWQRPQTCDLYLDLSRDDVAEVWSLPKMIAEPTRQKEPKP